MSRLRDVLRWMPSCVFIVLLTTALVLWPVSHYKPINFVLGSNSNGLGIIAADGRICLTRFWTPGWSVARGTGHAEIVSRTLSYYTIALYDAAGKRRQSQDIGTLEHLQSPANRWPAMGLSGLDYSGKDYVNISVGLIWLYGRLWYEEGSFYLTANPRAPFGAIGLAQIMFAPLHLLALALLLLFAANIRRALAWMQARRARYQPPFCRRCGYNLSGNLDAERCSECGQPIAVDGVEKGTRLISGKKN
jgi:hypothetical protein